MSLFTSSSWGNIPLEFSGAGIAEALFLSAVLAGSTGQVVMLEEPALNLQLALEVFSLIRHLLEFARPDHSTVAIVLGLVLPVVILLYFLVDPNVRAAFFRR